MTEQEMDHLTEIALNMRQRGESYRGILALLNSKCADPELVNKIISDVGKLEKQDVLKPEVYEEEIPIMDRIMGVFLMLGGVTLAVLLWNKGFVGILPFLMIIGGFWAFYGRPGMA